MSEEISPTKKVTRKSRFDLLRNRLGREVEIPVEGYVSPAERVKIQAIKRQEKLSEFSGRLSFLIRDGIKNKLYEESPLRNEFQVRPLEGGELSIINVKKNVYCIDENGTTVVVARSSKGHGSHYTPFFEISSNPEFPYKKFESLSIKENKDFLIDKCYPSILNAEKNIYNKLMDSRDDYTDGYTSFVSK